MKVYIYYLAYVVLKNSKSMAAQTCLSMVSDIWGSTLIPKH